MKGARPPSSAIGHLIRALKQMPLRTLLLSTLLTFVVSLLALHSIVQNDVRHLESTNPVQQAFLRIGRTPNPKSLLYPVEAPVLNPPLPADGASHFSACLLVMDDNPRLAEWLAYHYHVLPLRYLIVAVDPRSQTSPTFFFNRWRRLGMVVEEWTDHDFWRSRNMTGKEPSRTLDESTADLQTKRDRHRGRQKYFYRTCLERMQEQNRTWVTLNDSDEYLVYNHAGGVDFPTWQDRMQKRHEASKIHGTKPRMQPSMTPPTTGDEGQMIHYIEHERAAGLSYYQSPCIGVPRLQFGTGESSESDVRARVPNAVTNVVHDLDTVRWRRHAPRNDFVKNALGKVILDVSRLPIIEKLPYFTSLHRPIKKLCPAPWNNEWESGLRINHYLGSWAAYSFRDDSRRGGERSREQWEYKAERNQEQTDDVIRPWVAGFVEKHGPQQAKALLQDAGVPQKYVAPSADDPHWLMDRHKLAEILATNETVVNDNKKIAFDTWVRQRYRRMQPQLASQSKETTTGQ